MTFFSKDFFSKYDQIRNFVIFIEEILNGKLHFLHSEKSFNKDVRHDLKNFSRMAKAVFLPSPFLKLVTYILQ